MGADLNPFFAGAPASDRTPGHVPTVQDDGSVAWAPGGGGGGLSIYGDGSSGALVLHDGDTWAPGFYTDVTIEAGATVTLVPGADNDSIGQGFPVYFGTGTFTILGVLDLRGTDAINLNAGINPVTSGYGDGVTASPGPGTEPPKLTGSPDAPHGGGGGNGSSGSGGAARTSGHTNPALGVHNAMANIAGTSANWPGGGSSGAGDGVNYGGGGGSGAAFAVLCFRHIVHGPDNNYLLKGGDGAPGGDDGTGSTGHGDCGGGGAGGNGWWMTVSDDITGAGQHIDNSVGQGGVGCGTGTNGQDGQPGFAVHILTAA